MTNQPVELFRAQLMFQIHCKFIFKIIIIRSAPYEPAVSIIDMDEVDFLVLEDLEHEVFLLVFLVVVNSESVCVIP